MIIAVIGCITGIAGLGMSIYGLIHNRAVAVHEFLTKMEDREFIKARGNVYGRTYGKMCALNDEDAAQVINMFHHWGLLAKRRYLPMWVFDSASGAGVCRLYEITQNYIESSRKRNKDPKYAEYFTWLYGETKKRQEKEEKKQKKQQKKAEKTERRKKNKKEREKAL